MGDERIPKHRARLTVTMSKKLISQLRKLAKKRGVGVSQIVEFATSNTLSSPMVLKSLFGHDVALQGLKGHSIYKLCLMAGMDEGEAAEWALGDHEQSEREREAIEIDLYENEGRVARLVEKGLIDKTRDWYISSMTASFIERGLLVEKDGQLVEGETQGSE